jgi:DNA repair ATPase RecN
MIEFIDIENVQAIKKAHIELHPGINVFYGETDQGKSIIIRSLDQLINNNLPISSLVNWDLPKSKAQSKIAIQKDGHYIARKMGKENAYILDDKVYKVPKQGMPDEIKEMLNMDNINIQQQLSAPFLLTSSITSGQIAKRLNSVVGLSKIDDTTFNINSIIRDIKSKQKIHEDEIAKHTKALKRFEWLDEFEKEVDKLKRKYNRLLKMMEVVKKANKSQDILHELYERKNTFSATLELKTHVLSISKLIEKRNELQSTLRQARSIKKKLHQLSIQKQKTQKMVLLQKPVKTLNNITSQYIEVNEKLAQARKMRAKLEKMQASQAEFEKNKTRQIKALIKLKKKVQICPICGSEFKECFYEEV